MGPENVRYGPYPNSNYNRKEPSFMTNHRSSNPEDATDFVPTCRFMDSCDRLLDPYDCDSCDFNNPDLLRDEDGEPLRVSNHPESR